MLADNLPWHVPLLEVLFPCNGGKGLHMFREGRYVAKPNNIAQYTTNYNDESF